MRRQTGNTPPAAARRFPVPRYLFRALGLGAALFLFCRLTAKQPQLRSTFAALFTALVLHECGHLLAMAPGSGKKSAAGRPVGTARFYPWGVELRTGRSYRSYKEQIFVSLAGVGMNFLTAALLFASHAVRSGAEAEGDIRFFLLQLARYSLLLGFLQLLPVEGLDGGSALEGALLALTPLSPDGVERLLRALSILLLIPLWLLSLCVLIGGGGNPSFFALCVSLFFKLYRKQSESSKLPSVQYMQNAQRGRKRKRPSGDAI